jgi:uncharacterized repeat protein (TIGR01451 family)
MKSVSCVVFALLIVVGNTPAFADPIRFDLTFEDDGVFPPAENPNTQYFSPAVAGIGDPIPENEAFPEVSGGLLKQRMGNLGQTSSGISRYQSHAGQMNGAESFRLEMRVKVQTIGDDYNFCVFERNGSEDFLLLFESEGVQLADGTEVKVDHSLEHTYTLNSLGNTSSYNLLIDGVYRVTGIAGPVPGGENAFAFGDSNPGGRGWDVDYDYVRFLQNVESVPATILSATKTVSGSVLSGGTVNYTIVITNTGSSASANNIGNEFTDVLPTALFPVGVKATSGTVVANLPTNTVAWNGNIPAAGSVTITITATIKAGFVGTVTNQGSLSYDGDLNGSNETTALTDSPSLPGASDPTTFVIATGSAAEVPTVSELGLLVFGLGLWLAALSQLRRLKAGINSR